MIDPRPVLPGRLAIADQDSAVPTPIGVDGQNGAGVVEGGRLWLPVAHAADLMGTYPAAVRRMLEKPEIGLEAREVPGRGGANKVRIELALDSLPPAAQSAYYRQAEPQLTAVEEDRTAVDLSVRNYAADWGREKADGKKILIQRFNGYFAERGGRGKVAALKDFCALPDATVSWQTLNSYIKEYREGGYLGLLDAYGNRAGDTVLTDDDKRLLRETYCIHGLSKHQAYDRLVKVVHRLGRSAPSSTTVNGYLSSTAVERERAYHQGPKTFETRYEPHLRLDYAELRPLDVVVADHHRMKAFVLKTWTNGAGEFKWSFYRPWLTAFMDAKTRRFVGWVVCERPSSLTINQAFVMMAADCGIPKKVKFDWGKDFLAKHFIAGRFHPKFPHSQEATDLQGIFALLDIDFIATKPYHGQSKVIERHFKEVIHQWAKLWDAYCGSDPKKVPEHCRRVLAEAEREMKTQGETLLVPTIEQFAGSFGNWLHHTYHQEPMHGHGMNGRSPIQAWNDEIHDRPVRVMTTDQLQYLLCRKDVRTVGKNGIEDLFDADYWADELAGEVGMKVRIYWDPEDLSSIYVHARDGRPICKARRDPRASQIRNEGQFQELGRRKKLVRKKTQELGGLRRDLQRQAIELHTIRREAEAPDNPVEPQRPSQIAPAFNHPSFQAVAFFQAQEARRAANAPDLPDTPHPAQLVADLFKDVNSRPVVADPAWQWADFYTKPTEEDET